MIGEVIGSGRRKGGKLVYRRIFPSSTDARRKGCEKHPKNQTGWVCPAGDLPSRVRVQKVPKTLHPKKSLAPIIHPIVKDRRSIERIARERKEDLLSQVSVGVAASQKLLVIESWRTKMTQAPDGKKKARLRVQASAEG